MITDAVVAAFVAIPLLLVGALTWATAAAWRRSGAAASDATRAAAMIAVAALGWMAFTWVTAQVGIFRDWQRTPPPFAFLVLMIFVLAGAIAWSPLGLRIA